MGMSTAYVDPTVDEAQSIETIHRALELGVTFIDPPRCTAPTGTKSWWGGRSRAGVRRSCLPPSSA